MEKFKSNFDRVAGKATSNQQVKNTQKWMRPEKP